MVMRDVSHNTKNEILVHLVSHIPLRIAKFGFSKCKRICREDYSFMLLREIQSVSSSSSTHSASRPTLKSTQCCHSTLSNLSMGAAIMGMPSLSEARPSFIGSIVKSEPKSPLRQPGRRMLKISINSLSLWCQGMGPYSTNKRNEHGEACNSRKRAKRRKRILESERKEGNRSYINMDRKTSSTLRRSKRDEHGEACKSRK